jgi:hypothetical protein
MQCPSCSSNNVGEARFCPQCGSTLSRDETVVNRTTATTGAPVIPQRLIVDDPTEPPEPGGPHATPATSGPEDLTRLPPLASPQGPSGPPPVPAPSLRPPPTPSGATAVAPGVGFGPPSAPWPMATKFCSSCGNGLVASAAMCPRCGTQQGTPREKTTAVLLAVFLGSWTWLYTYKRDTAKFWVGLGVGVLGALLAVVLVGYFVILGIWIWAIVDAASKPESWYRSFPNG